MICLLLLTAVTDVEIPARIRQVKAEHDAKIVRKRQTAFNALLESDLPAHEKSENRLIGEAGVFLIAGTDVRNFLHSKASILLFKWTYRKVFCEAQTLGQC